MHPRLSYALFRSLGALLEHLPERFDVAAAEGVAGAIGSAMARRDTALSRNIATALRSEQREPDPDLLSRYVQRGMRAYGQYWAEGAKLPALEPAEVTARIRLSEGEEHLRAAVERGQGVVLALPHIGSWEWGGMFLADIGWKMTAVAERLEPPELFEWFVAKREAMGLDIIALDDGAGASVMRVVRSGKVLGLLCDRDIQGNGIPARLLGAPVTVPPGPATVALRTGATLLCAAVYSGPGRDHHVVVTPPIDTQRRDGLRADIARVTQSVCDELSWLIRRAPEQWHVLQDVVA